MKYSQSIALGLIGAAALASAHPTSGRRASKLRGANSVAVPEPATDATTTNTVKSRSYEDDLLFLRDLFEDVLAARAPTAKAHTTAAKPVNTKQQPLTGAHSTTSHSTTSHSTTGKVPPTNGRTTTGAHSKTPATGANAHTGVNAKTGAHDHTTANGKTGANSHSTTGAHDKTGANSRTGVNSKTGVNIKTGVNGATKKPTDHSAQLLANSRKQHATDLKQQKQLSGQVTKDKSEISHLQKEEATWKHRAQRERFGGMRAAPAYYAPPPPVYGGRYWRREIVDDADLFERDFEFEDVDARDFDEDSLDMRFIDFEIDELD